MSFRARGKKGKNPYPMAIPVMSVDTLKEATSLQTFTCFLAYAGDRFIINASSGFVRSDVHSLKRAADYLERSYNFQQQRRAKSVDGKE